MQNLKNRISLARRAGKIVIGYDRMKSGRIKADLVVLACDASERTKIHSAKFADDDNVVVSSLSMAQLGKVFGSDKVAVFAVTEAGLARLIRQSLMDFQENSLK